MSGATDVPVPGDPVAPGYGEKVAGSAATMTVRDRVLSYCSAFPQWPASWPTYHDGRMYGMWMLGQDYRNKSRLYGAYPPNYLDRVGAFFPDARPGRILHLFSGSLPVSDDYLRLDVREDADTDITGDAEMIDVLWSDADLPAMDVVYADPPYSVEDAERYGPPMVSRNKVMKALRSVVRPGGWVVWLDQAWPMFSKRDWTFRGSIGVVRSTNHRVRAVFFFERTDSDV